jgi:hypothetical protein
VPRTCPPITILEIFFYPFSFLGPVFYLDSFLIFSPSSRKFISHSFLNRLANLFIIFFSIFPKIAEKLGKTPAQVVLWRGIQRGTSVLPKSTNFDQLRSNLELTDWALSEEDMKALSSIDDQVRSRSLLILIRVSFFEHCGRLVGCETWPLAVF